MSSTDYTTKARGLVPDMTDQQREAFWAKAQRIGECLVWQEHLNNMGYGQYHLSRKPQLAHRVAYALAVRPLFKGEQVLHRCDNPACIRPTHLFAGTQRDNIADMSAKGRAGGRFKLGQRAHNRRFTNDQIREIRHMHANGMTMSEIARRFGVVEGTIWFIVRGVSYRDVPA